MDVSVYDAKTHLSRLLNQVQKGKHVVITRSGRPVARLVPISPEPRSRVLGVDAGRGWIAPDFDAPLPDATLAEFEG
jgi:prevent-host-death family protein